MGSFDATIIVRSRAEKVFGCLTGYHLESYDEHFSKSSSSIHSSNASPQRVHRSARVKKRNKNETKNELPLALSLFFVVKVEKGKGKGKGNETKESLENALSNYKPW
jgi:hypothetical protein